MFLFTYIFKGESNVYEKILYHRADQHPDSYSD